MFRKLCLTTENGDLETFEIFDKNNNAIILDIDQLLQTNAKSGNLDMVNFLINCDQKVHISMDAYCYAMEKSSKYGYLGIVKALSEFRKDLDYKYSIKLSIENGHFLIAKFLINRTRYYDYALKVCTKYNRNTKVQLEIIDLLLEKGADIHYDEDVALRNSAKNGNLEFVSFLVEKDADICAKKNYALKMSAENGHFDVVKYLVENEASIHADKDHALRWSAINGHYEIVEYLIEMEADIYANNNEALQRSAANGHYSVVYLLIKNGAYIHANNDYALQISVLNNYPKIARFLIKNGAYVLVNYGTVIITCIENENHDLINYALKHCSLSKLKIMLKNTFFRDTLQDYLLENEPSKYSDLVSLYREYGIDIFDMIENEK